MQTGTELISLALVFNKVTGFYGFLALFTGYQLSLLQFSTYVYSIAVLVALVYLIPHIRKQTPFECLALAWLYALDCIINAAYTFAFGLDWYFTSTATDSVDKPSSVSGIVSESLEGLRQETAVHGKIIPQETAMSMVLITGATLIRVYFTFVIMAYARQALQKYMQLMILEGPGVDDRDGPFGADLPDGDGRTGRMGRMMVSFPRRYWLGASESGNWPFNDAPRKSNSSGTLAGEV